jgi:hypothetical protein
MFLSPIGALAWLCTQACAEGLDRSLRSPSASLKPQPDDKRDKTAQSNRTRSQTLGMARHCSYCYRLASAAYSPLDWNRINQRVPEHFTTSQTIGIFKIAPRSAKSSIDQQFVVISFPLIRPAHEPDLHNPSVSSLYGFQEQQRGQIR